MSTVNLKVMPFMEVAVCSLRFIFQVDITHTFYGFPDFSGRSKGSIVIIFETGINQHKVLRILSNHKKVQMLDASGNTSGVGGDG